MVQTIFCAVLLAMLHFNTPDFLIVVMFAVFIILVRNDSGPLGRLLSLPLPHYLGLISYSIYLNHAVVQLIISRTERSLGADIYESSVWTMASPALMFVVTILLSTITYEFIEKPSRKLVRDYWITRKTA